MMRKDKQSEDKLEKTKRILEYIPLMFFTILAVIAVSFVFFQEIVSDIFGNIYLQICIVAALLTFVCTIMIWRITRITQKEEREKIDIWVNDKNKAIMQKVDEFSIECVKGLVSNQKRLFGPYIDEIDKIKQKDIIKTLDFLNAIKRYDSEGVFTDEEIEKAQELIRALRYLDSKRILCSYANMEDLMWLEQNVAENGTIDIISQNVTDNDELKKIIIDNLKRGVKYNYYLYREAGIEDLKTEFLSNVKDWEKMVGKDIVKQQVKCWIVPPEFVQMVIIIYNTQNLERDSVYKTGVIVKLPKVNDNIKAEFPLFFYITDHRDLLIHFKKSLEHLRENSVQYNY